MIKTIDLTALAFREEDKQIEELKQDTTLSQKEIDKRIKAIHKNTQLKIKQIKKDYPLEKEVNRILKEN